ncbi:GntR family transcriptional regulator [Streptomyces achromogenes]|uniref:GntR family transcriptional regulator n=1 Tax=Streptomyces achromogenes TaxID=67255 RepID=UPI003A7FDE51
MPATPAPRGTYLTIAKEIAAEARADPEMEELPSVHDVMARYGVSRGLVLRAFHHLEKEGVAVPVPGARWRVAWRGPQVEEKPLAARIADVITEDQLQVGAAFPSETKLAERLGVSRPTVRKALAELETAGILTAGGQGRQRSVKAIPEDSATS